MEKKENILVFDSGIGGVTVLKEIIKILPNENYIYYSDSKNKSAIKLSISLLMNVKQ